MFFAFSFLPRHGHFLLTNFSLYPSSLYFLSSSLSVRKSLASTYQAGARGGKLGGWRKLKKDFIDELGDSIDVAVVGGWQGTGRKKEWFSPFLVAVWNAETETFQTLCRVMSGFTDEFYRESFEFYKDRQLDEQHSSVDSNESNRFFFEPCEVWEIRGADLTRSPVHTAGIGCEGEGGEGEEEEEERGIGLRFPRFIRKRPDKSIHEATNAAEIVGLFKKQFVKAGGGEEA